MTDVAQTLLLGDYIFESTHPSLKRFTDRAQPNLVIYFYPKDNTPGCTRQTCEFSKDYETFLAQGTEIIGISRDSIKSHERFIQKYDIPFPLISDKDSALCEAFGIIKPKSLFGKTALGIQRSTFLFDANNDCRMIWRNVTVKGHVAAVLEEVKKLA